MLAVLQADKDAFSKLDKASPELCSIDKRVKMI